MARRQLTIDNAVAAELAGFIPDCAILIGRLARDRRVPPGRRALLLGVVVYLGMPIDLVPDFLPVAGQLDDAVVVALALRLVARVAGAELLREAWPGPDASLTVVLRAAGLHRNGPDRPAPRATL